MIDELLTQDETIDDEIQMTTLSLPLEMKLVDLKDLKLIKQEPYYAVIGRLIDFYNKNNGPTSSNNKN